MANKRIIGTIAAVFDGALDGMAARLISRGRVGYLVELAESRGTFRQGDIVHLSPAEFLLPADHMADVPLRDASSGHAGQGYSPVSG
jgi:hypothetical protein